MRISITGKNIDVSDYLNNLIEKKVAKLDKYFSDDTTAHVTLAVERNRHIVEVTIPYSGGIIRGEETSGDMYASIDNAVTYIERQIHKYKTKLEKRLRHGAFEREIPSVEPAAMVDEDEDFSVIRIKKFDLKPMTPEEAILQMNLLNHQFFVFRNSSMSGAFAVAYKRSHGGYGIIVGE